MPRICRMLVRALLCACLLIMFGNSLWSQGIKFTVGTSLTDYANITNYGDFRGGQGWLIEFSPRHNNRIVNDLTFGLSNERTDFSLSNNGVIRSSLQTTFSGSYAYVNFTPSVQFINKRLTLSMGGQYRYMFSAHADGGFWQNDLQMESVKYMTGQEKVFFKSQDIAAIFSMEYLFDIGEGVNITLAYDYQYGFLSVFKKELDIDVNRIRSNFKVGVFYDLNFIDLKKDISL